jgi:hypothetical protein
VRRTRGTHEPSDHLAACDPCRGGNHGGCAELVSGDACHCYDDDWEWHESIDPNVRLR